MKDGWQKGQKAAPICVGGPPVPRRHRQHHLFRRWLQRWPWPVTLAIVAIREGNELTLVQLGLSYFTPSGPSLAPCLPAGDLKKPSRCRAPREPWWWAPAVESADSGEHCSWYVKTTYEPYPRVGQPRAAVVRAAHPGHGPQHQRLCQCLRVSRHKASPDEKTQPQGRHEKPTCCA